MIAAARQKQTSGVYDSVGCKAGCWAGCMVCCKKRAEDYQSQNINSAVSRNPYPPRLSDIETTQNPESETKQEAKSLEAAARGGCF
jgi:hypothetical protein